MKLETLFPNFNIPVLYRDLQEDCGQYWFKSDVIVLDLDMKKTLPACSALVLLHEMFHSTAARKRLMRIDRLINNFGTYNKGTLSYRVEECIAEICTMAAAIKLGLYNEYSRTAILSGLETYYSPDIYIPIREVRAALKYFAEEGTSFEEEIETTKLYLETSMGIKFQDCYREDKAS